MTVTITAATAADFTLTLNTSTATVARSSSTPATITITPTGGFKAATTLACTGAPANSTCTISPSSVTPADGTTPVTATLTFQASVATASLHNSRAFEWAATLPLGLIGSTALFGLGLRRRRWPLQLLALTAATILLGRNRLRRRIQTPSLNHQHSNTWHLPADHHCHQRNHNPHCHLHRHDSIAATQNLAIASNTTTYAPNCRR